jgi:hypothetical protein
VDPRRSDDFGAAQFVRELEADGFRVVSVDLEKGQSLPADTRIVVTLSDAQPFSATAAEVITNFVDAGGRWFVSVGAASGAGTAAELVRRYGVEVVPRGIVARPVPSLGGGMMQGTPACADLSIDPTAWLRRTR